MHFYLFNTVADGSPELLSSAHADDADLETGECRPSALMDGGEKVMSH
ncbi:hypothetical protein NSMM_330076 [Nitrosomonas mobilis]|uniref:Uncharacterized protein n=1 Tax=Nitrosomonas mobilis TaxID=51642 RepID=A0A1G5SCX4_9PROT|nr:hypothetical protein NSMM_330076 [Nitrosomonas mobilis]